MTDSSQTYRKRLRNSSVPVEMEQSTTAIGDSAATGRSVTDSAAQEERIKLHVIDQRGTGLRFKLRPSTTIRRLKKSYALRTGLDENILRFVLDGERVADDQSMEELELQDDDFIEVYTEQLGGSFSAFDGASPDLLEHDYDIGLL